jgi:solute carrier family 35 protein F5
MESTPLILKMPPAVIVSTASRYLVGVGLLLSVVFVRWSSAGVVNGEEGRRLLRSSTNSSQLWTASNFITADLETGDEGWNKPFL